MSVVVLPLLAAAVWGAADFVGGRTSRAVRPLVVVLWVNVVGLVACGAVALATGASLGATGLAWCAAAGLASGAGFVTFYAALAAGSMSLVAPLVASGAAVPALIAVAGGDRVSVLLGVGLGCALAGSVLAARPAAPAAGGGARATLPRRALVLAVLAALLIGAILALLQQATDAPGSDALAVVAATRGFALCVCLAAVLALRAPVGVPRDLRRDVVAVGIADTAANALFAIASSGDDDAIAAVLSSLYPVVTVLLAALVLRERLAPAQGLGIALALTGVVLVSAGA